MRCAAKSCSRKHHRADLRNLSKFEDAQTSMDSSAPPSFLCPISQEIMRDPVTCADGHSYERASIERWLDTHNTSQKLGRSFPTRRSPPTTRCGTR